jgi:hypothetical protein
VRMWPLSSFSVCRPPCSGGGAATSPLLLRHALLVLRWCDSGSSLIPPPLDLYGDRIELLLRHLPFSDHPPRPPMPQSPTSKYNLYLSGAYPNPNPRPIGESDGPKAAERRRTSMLLFHRSDIFKRCGPLTLTYGHKVIFGNSILKDHVWYSFSRFSKAIFSFSC